MTQGAPLHARVGALVQILRFAGGIDGVSLPPLPDGEAALLVAAEASVDLQVSRAWRQVQVELEEEGVSPMPADKYRMASRKHAGGARIDGVWAAQAFIRERELASVVSREARHYGGVLRQTNSDPMQVPLGEARLRAQGLGGAAGGLSFEDRRRGQLAMKAMLQRVKEPYVPDKRALAEVRQTQRQLHGPSRLEARAAAWIFEMAGKDANAAAAKVQAIQRGRAARQEVDAARRQREAADKANREIQRHLQAGASVREMGAGYYVESPPKSRSRRRGPRRRTPGRRRRHRRARRGRGHAQQGEARARRLRTIGDQGGGEGQAAPDRASMRTATAARTRTTER